MAQVCSAVTAADMSCVELLSSTSRNYEQCHLFVGAGHTPLHGLVLEKQAELYAKIATAYQAWAAGMPAIQLCMFSMLYNNL